jgi:hypothetical protein
MRGPVATPNHGLSRPGLTVDIVLKQDQRAGRLQVKRLDGRDSAGQAKFVESLFGVAA